ncbi:MAG: hypothetical protein ACI9JD_002595 [Rhodococcus sp. (in: high G+C Gram-positive bacteria)]|jgi:hypothetical protein
MVQPSRRAVRTRTPTKVAARALGASPGLCRSQTGEAHTPSLGRSGVQSLWAIYDVLYASEETHITTHRGWVVMCGEIYDHPAAVQGCESR